MPGGACCALAICCPPGEAATALSAKYGVPTDSALAMLADFRLVPKHLGATDTAPDAAKGASELVYLNNLVDAELRRVLPMLGHPVEHHGEH